MYIFNEIFIKKNHDRNFRMENKAEKERLLRLRREYGGYYMDTRY